MTNKKSIFVTFCLSFLMTIGLFAQRPQKGKMLEFIKENLDLSSQQTAQLEAIQAETIEKMKELKGTEQSTEKRTSRRDIYEAQRDKFIAVLTPEQQAKLKELRSEKREDHKAFREANKGKFKEMHEDRKAYYKENIEPSLIKQRIKLDAQMSPEDVAYVNKFRAKIKERKEEEGHLKGDRDKEERKEKFEAMKSIADKYANEIDALQAEIQPMIDEWENDMQEMKEEHKEGIEYPECMTKKEGKKMRKHVYDKGHKDINHKRVRFLLMPTKTTRKI